MILNTHTCKISLGLLGYLELPNDGGGDGYHSDYWDLETSLQNWYKCLRSANSYLHYEICLNGALFGRGRKLQTCRLLMRNVKKLINPALEVGFTTSGLSCFYSEVRGTFSGHTLLCRGEGGCWLGWQNALQVEIHYIYNWP